MLLLVVVVALWLLVVKELVSRNPDSPGVVIKKWSEIIRVIATDNVESKN